jgi:hypothetical protein
MRDNLRFSPAYPRPDQRTVWVMPQGSRSHPVDVIGPRDESGRAPQVTVTTRYQDLAKWNQRGHPIHGVDGKGRVYSGRVPARPWIGLTQQDLSKIAIELSAPPSSAWLDTRYKERVALNHRRGRAEMVRIRRALRRGDDAAMARAESQLRIYNEELARIGGR